MRATSIWKAFFLGAFVMAIVSVGAVEARKYVEELGWFKDKHEVIKGLGTFLVSFLVGLFSYLLMYLFFGFGEGMLVPTAAVADAINTKK